MNQHALLGDFMTHVTAKEGPVMSGVDKIRLHALRASELSATGCCTASSRSASVLHDEDKAGLAVGPCPVPAVLLAQAARAPNGNLPRGEILRVVLGAAEDLARRVAMCSRPRPPGDSLRLGEQVAPLERDRTVVRCDQLDHGGAF